MRIPRGCATQNNNKQYIFSNTYTHTHVGIQKGGFVIFLILNYAQNYSFVFVFVFVVFIKNI